MIKSLGYASFYTILIISLRKFLVIKLLGQKIDSDMLLNENIMLISLPSLSLETS